MTIVGRSRIDIPSGTSFAPSTSTNSRTSPTETNTMGEPNRQRRVGASPESVCWVLTRGVRRPSQEKQQHVLKSSTSVGQLSESPGVNKPAAASSGISTATTPSSCGSTSAATSRSTSTSSSPPAREGATTPASPAGGGGGTT